MLSDPLSLTIPFDHVPAVPVGPTRKLLTPSSSHPDDYILEIDYSSISDFTRCPRASENKLVFSREANRDTAATSFGRLFHECEELRLRHGYSDAVRQRQAELVMNHFLRYSVGAGEYRTGDRMLEVLKQYNERYKDDRWPESVLQVEGEPFVERAFKVPLCTVPVEARAPYQTGQIVKYEQGLPWEPDETEGGTFLRNIHVVFTGRIDAVLTQGEALWVIDHKTSSRGGKEFQEAFFLSSQTRGYTWAAQQLLGTPVSGLIMNAVVVRPLTKTGTGTEFDRHTYHYTPDSLEEWRENMVATMTDFISCLVRGFFPQSARSFKSPCAGCDYQDNYRLPRAQRTADLASDLFRDCTWNPIDLGEGGVA